MDPLEQEELGQGGLSWEADVGLLTNPLILRQMATALAVTALIMFGLLSLLFAVQGEWESIPMALLATLVGVGVVAVLAVLVMLLFFGNRLRARFTVTETGYAFETVDRRARTGNRLALFLGALGAKPAVAGAGMIAVSREEEAGSWRGIAAASYHAGWRGIVLRNRWRTVAFLACTPANYEQVAEFVRQRLPAPGSGRAAARRSPLPGLLVRSALVVLAMLPVLLLPYPFEQDLLLPLIMLCFALATVWLVPLFGWVVIVCALAIAARIMWAGLEVKTSMFQSLGSYRSFELLNADDWAALALAGLGLAYLVVYSWRAVHGRVPSALSQDYAEME